MVSRLLIRKQTRSRKYLNHFFFDRLFLKSVTSNFFLPKKVFAYYQIFFFSLLFYTKVHNFCFLTFRRRGSLTSFHLTRMMFKYYAAHKFLMGVKKTSW